VREGLDDLLLKRARLDSLLALPPARFFQVWTTLHSPTDSWTMLASVGGWAVHLGNVGWPRGDLGRGGDMILAQLSDPHIVAAGKLFRCPMQGTAPDAERTWLEFDTAPYLLAGI
jgi:hypothetical protein